MTAKRERKSKLAKQVTECGGMAVLNDMQTLQDLVIEEGERFSSRYYCNKRLGEFLKALDLSEEK